MKQIFLFLLCLSLGGSLEAQLNHGGAPLNWSDKRLDGAIPFLVTPALDRALIAAQDAIGDPVKEAPWRFGIEVPVQAGLSDAGTWTLYPEQNLAVWMLGIECPGATGISLEFSHFRVPKGGKMYLWDADRQLYRGALTHRNNKDHLGMSVGLISSDRIVIEYQVPIDASDRGNIELGTVVHAYRGLRSKLNELEDAGDRGPFGNSGACNINVNCPQGDAWQVEKRSVALITDGGWAVCSGALVNNTNNDGTPYFLTANHCLGGESGWLFYFNHESASCSGSTGPVDDSISGSELKASNAGSDVALLLLDETPPASWNVQYAGWDATDSESAVSSATGIHHPSGDVKKICFEEDAPYHSFQAGAQVWFIDNWEEGVTEGGSSGSPLFNQSHRIIGQLYGGASACAGTVNNGLFDYYGRFGVSWDAGSSASTRLSDWLAPGNPGITVLDGWPEGFTALSYDAGISGIEGISQTLCGSLAYPVLVLQNFGVNTLVSATIHYALNGGPEQVLEWTGSIAQYDSDTVQLPALTAANGNNTLTVWVTEPNGQDDQNVVNDETAVFFTAFTGEVLGFSLQLVTDDYPEETSWTITDEDNNLLYSGGPYTVVSELLVLDACLPAGCYVLTMSDSYGDGLCCNWGDGSYTLLNSEGDVLAEGAEFAFTDSQEFCLEIPAGVYEVQGTAISAWPNPASGEIRFSAKESAPLEVRLFDPSGRLVVQQTGASGKCSLDTGQLPAGMYYARCLSAGVISSLPVQVIH